MIETASSVITDALQQILVQASEASIEADEAQTAIRSLNRMMARWDADGISLGYTEVSNLADEITVPAGAIDGVIYNLAVSLAPQFDAAITPALAALASEGFKTIKRIAVDIPPTMYGSTLPIGSGSEDYCTYSNKYYTGYPESIQAETTGTIVLEDDTAENT